MKRYVELHIHSTFTRGNSVLTIDAAVDRAVSYGMDSLGIMDSGTMDGVDPFIVACETAGIKPIVGCGFYFTLGDHHHISPEKYHLPVIAETATGLANLATLNWIAHTDGLHVRPQIDMGLLRTHREGLIVLTGGRGGAIDKLLKAGQYSEAKQLLVTLGNVVGENAVFVELQDNGRESDAEANQKLVELADECGVPVVVTGGPFYLDSSDAESCNEVRRENHNGELVGDSFNFRSPEEQAKRFRHCEDALYRSGEIADRCRY